MRDPSPTLINNRLLCSVAPVIRSQPGAGQGMFEVVASGLARLKTNYAIYIYYSYKSCSKTRGSSNTSKLIQIFYFLPFSFLFSALFSLHCLPCRSTTIIVKGNEIIQIPVSRTNDQPAPSAEEYMIWMIDVPTAPKRHLTRFNYPISLMLTQMAGTYRCRDSTAFTRSQVLTV